MILYSFFYGEQPEEGATDIRTNLTDLAFLSLNLYFVIIAAS